MQYSMSCRTGATVPYYHMSHLAGNDLTGESMSAVAECALSKASLTLLGLEENELGSEVRAMRACVRAMRACVPCVHACMRPCVHACMRA